jgi:hypothetical protein
MTTPVAIDPMQRITLLLSGATATPNYETRTVYVALARTLYTTLQTDVAALGRALDASEQDLRRVTKGLAAPLRQVANR